MTEMTVLTNKEGQNYVNDNKGLNDSNDKNDRNDRYDRML